MLRVEFRILRSFQNGFPNFTPRVSDFDSLGRTVSEMTHWRFTTPSRSRKPTESNNLEPVLSKFEAYCSSREDSVYEGCNLWRST